MRNYRFTTADFTHVANIFGPRTLAALDERGVTITTVEYLPTGREFEVTVRGERQTLNFAGVLALADSCKPRGK